MNIKDFEDFLYYDYGNMKIAINNLTEAIKSFEKALIQNNPSPEVLEMLNEINTSLKTLCKTHDNFPNVLLNW